jgi:dipeptide/tripeptide permease
MAADVGAIIGPIAAGALAETASFSVAFALSAGVALVALVAWSRVRGGSPPDDGGTRRA